MDISLNKWGNSIGLRLPKHILEKYDLQNGSTLEIEERKDGILLRKRQKVKLSEIIESYGDNEIIPEIFTSSLPTEDWDWKETK